MSAPAKLAAFAVALIAIFGGAAAAGAITQATPPAASSASKSDAMGGGMAASDHAEQAMSMGPRGLGVAEDGLRLIVPQTAFHTGKTQPLRFQIIDKDGQPIRSFDVEHTKRMHLIVVRRDMAEYQHLHPTMTPTGTWTIPVRLPQPGAYRMFADFSYHGTPITLAADLFVDGDAHYLTLPPARPTAQTDGYTVQLSHTDGQGDERHLRFTVSRDGKPVALHPYLGADGHLVALRQGDLAFLHVHPTGSGNASHGVVTFDATFPTEGAYRLFLQFRSEDGVHTAAFTLEVHQ